MEDVHYVLRHGEIYYGNWVKWRIMHALWNDRDDPPLSMKGFETSSKIGNDIHSTSFVPEAIVTSPFLRCMQTASQIQSAYAHMGLEKPKIIIEPLLGEFQSMWQHTCMIYPYGYIKSNGNSGDDIDILVDEWRDEDIDDGIMANGTVTNTEGCFLENKADSICEAAVRGNLSLALPQTNGLYTLGLYVADVVKNAIINPVESRQELTLRCKYIKENIMAGYGNAIFITHASIVSEIAVLSGLDITKDDIKFSGYVKVAGGGCELVNVG